jgi:hypothetical protein
MAGLESRGVRVQGSESREKKAARGTPIFLNPEP